MKINKTFNNSTDLVPGFFERRALRRANSDSLYTRQIESIRNCPTLEKQAERIVSMAIEIFAIQSTRVSLVTPLRDTITSIIAHSHSSWISDSNRKKLSAAIELELTKINNSIPEKIKKTYTAQTEHIQKTELFWKSQIQKLNKEITKTQNNKERKQRLTETKTILENCIIPKDSQQPNNGSQLPPAIRESSIVPKKNPENTPRFEAMVCRTPLPTNLPQIRGPFFAILNQLKRFI